MKRHDRKYLKLLATLGLEVELFDIYVDDETEALVAVDPGVRFDREKLFVQEDMVEQDKEVAEDLRTMNLLKEISNSITACVQYTVDCPLG